MGRDRVVRHTGPIDIPLVCDKRVNCVKQSSALCGITSLHCKEDLLGVETGVAVDGRPTNVRGNARARVRV